jgi:hypothetical protein
MLLPCYFALLVVFFFGLNMMILLSVLREMGLGIKACATCVAVGVLETGSMANALFMMVKTGRFILCL